MARYSGTTKIIGTKRLIPALSFINSVKLEELLSLSASLLICFCGKVKLDTNTYKKVFGKSIALKHVDCLLSEIVHVLQEGSTKCI